MRKVIVHMQTTLDNRISNAEGGFWEPLHWGEEEMAYLNGLLASVDTWALTRRIYEFVIPYWEQVAAGSAPDIGVQTSPAREEFARLQLAMNKVVFSTTLDDDPATRRTVRSGDLTAHLRDLKNQPGRDIIASFGPRVLGPLAAVPGLIDEYLLVIHPAVLTAGPRLFEDLTHDLALRLVEAKVFDAGAVVLRYAASAEES
jgi:dihydrofolate reductase